MSDSADTARQLAELSAEQRRALLAELLAEEGSQTRRFPLSFAQQRLWFLDQLSPGNPFYCESSLLRFPLDVKSEVLERALNEIVRRHDTLRTTFEDMPEGPCQVIAPSLRITLPVDDVSGCDPDLREGEALRIASEERARPFDLTRIPLLRFRLVRLDREDVVLLMTLHHIICDGWSLSVLAGELSVLYEAFLNGQPSPLPELPIQYADFAVWQRKWLSGDTLQQQLAYWKKQLVGLPMLLLPLDFPRPSVQSFHGSTVPLEFPEGIYPALRSLARSEDATMFMVTLAAFAVVLHFYSGQDEIVIGTPVANRGRAELEGLIGFFVNSLVLRLDLQGEPSFREVIRRVRRVALDAFRHQDLPFEKLVEELVPERDMGRNPLFQVTFQMFAAPGSGSDSSETGDRRLEPRHASAKFDLRLDVYEYGGRLDGMIEYSTDLFQEDTMQRLSALYTRVLEQMVARPEQVALHAPLLTAEEKQEIIAAGRGETLDFSSLSPLPQLFEEQVSKTPDAVAVSLGDRSLNFRELNEQANRLAWHLRSLGIGPDVLAGVVIERSSDLVMALLAVLKAGGAYIPMDLEAPPERIAYMVEQSKARLVITLGRHLERLQVSGIPVLVLDQLDWSTLESTSNPQPIAGLENLAYVLYTSGTTGRPKGVMVPHRAVVTHMLWMENAFPVGPGDAVLQRTSTNFDASVWEFYAPLLAGARLVLSPPALAAETRAVVQTILDQKVTVVQVVPSLLRLLLDEPEFCNCISLKRLFCGGEPLPSELVNRLYTALPGTTMINLYGPTECTIDATFGICAPADPAPMASIGHLVANSIAYVVDERGELVPPDVPGELWIGGDCVGRGYLHQPELTAERFIPDPFLASSGARLYRSGDIVRWRSNGLLEFLGRRDQQVKVRGHRIELAEIEAVLGTSPEVKACAVEVRSIEGAQARLVAYVCPNWERLEASDGDAWQEVFDNIYQGIAGEDPALETVGWNRSDDGDRIPEADMREWAEETVGRIRRLKPRRILEIGCGTGMLLFRLADEVEHYCGIDFSAPALDHVRRNISTDHVRIEKRRAHELEGLGEGYDVVILNSVIQYFPSVEYLLQVLEKAARLLCAGGKIFVGDVRNHRLLDAFHAWLEWQKTGDMQNSRDEMADRARRRREEEEELVVAPSFFVELGSRLDSITAVEVEPKFGRQRNELVRFRYDVVLHAAASVEDPGKVRSTKWHGENLEEVERWIEECFQDGEVAKLIGLRVRRVEWPCELARWLKGEASEPMEEGSVAWEPEDVVRKHWDLHLRYSEAEGAYDLLVRPGLPRLWPDAAIAKSDWVPAKLANDPAQGKRRRELVGRLRARLSRGLPTYMVPGSWVLLDQLPVTANGKLDRKALQSFVDSVPAARSAKAVPPRNAVEEALLGAWTEVLGLDAVGVTDNFFHLGGHSLVATQLLSRIRQLFHIELSLRSLFEGPTIEQQGRLVTQAKASDSPRTRAPALEMLPRDRFRRAADQFNREAD
jgi:amino acid adenylation domain-containing protein